MVVINWFVNSILPTVELSSIASKLISGVAIVVGTNIGSSGISSIINSSDSYSSVTSLKQKV